MGSWCASVSILVEKTQEYRHPSHEVAVGQTKRAMRKLYYAQACPGSTLWAASCMYLQYRALRDADAAFGIVVPFRHAFPRDLFARIAFVPKPGATNDVVDPVDQPCVLLYPRWCSSNTVVGLVGSGSHLGLKLGEFTFQEVKVSKRAYVSLETSLRHCRFAIF